MNAVRKISYRDSLCKTEAKPNIYLVSNNSRKENSVLVAGKIMSKDDLNEKLAYFYEHGGPIMEL